MTEIPNLNGATLPTTTHASAFIGYWKITQMEAWAPDYVDLVVPGFIDFRYEDEHLMGAFQFGTVSGWLDCRLREGDGVTFIEWSWQGRSDADPGCGRGWATLVDDELVGRVFIHCGDDSAFKATRSSRPVRRPKRVTRRRGKLTGPHYN